MLDAGLAGRPIATAPFFDLPFHLASKCDGCEFNEFCLYSARKTQDLSLIPYLTERNKRMLESKGVRDDRGSAHGQDSAHIRCSSRWRRRSGFAWMS